MEVQGRNFKLAITITLSLAISIYLAAQFRKRRSQKQRKQSSTCYLEMENPKKPQSDFKRVLADNSYVPFKHLIFREGPAGGERVNVHPYKEEIGELLKNLNAEFAELFDGEMVTIEHSECVWIDTRSQLEELVAVLSKERVFGVDTEQHSLRSFLGFTSLIQVSTKTKDYLVDTIALHDVMGILRPVFANPHICKVFHGADNDILWLQRDFHIYVVNLFDTAKACDVLLKAQKSLAYLLEKYCRVSKNKLLQREDWRQRPLPAEMVEYARTDAHYLLHIANCLVSELKEYASENPSCPDDKFHFLLEAIRRSNATCLQLYTKDIEAYPGESTATSIISRYSVDQGSFHLNVCDTRETCSCLTKFQILVRRLCAWRDIMARVHDESLRYVLSEQAIGALSASVLTTKMGIFDTISTADISSDSIFLGSSIQSPSPVVCSHFEDFDLLFVDRTDEEDGMCYSILQRCLGSNGSCPLSIYNYYLLSKSTHKLTNGPVPKLNGLMASKVAARKNSRELFVQKFSCKSPVYHNCRIYANDGRLLCYCDRKKLEWYLSRELAKLVEDDPPAIMLLFEPKGRPEDEGNDFYIQSKKNICVGCGEGNHYLRYRIIPSCYRMHFPEHLKSHRSHDIVLLCVDCHEIAHAAAEKCKKQIAADFGIPLYVRHVIVSDQVKNSMELSSDASDMEVGVSPLQLRAAAMALLRHGSRMPSSRHEELTQIVAKYYGGREISNGDLERALLVGMSPHERRRLGKKRTLTFRHSAAQSIVVSHSTREEKCGKQENGENLDSNEDVAGHTICSNSRDNDADCNALDSVDNCLPVSESDDNSKNQNPLNKGTNLASSANLRYDSSNHDSKYSLLGHGPHGKQVVEYLLKEYGEDGILQFCQRWRQVFVEAVHPRFLPVGWDVKHSGRRDFGEFSVYKPIKKDSIATLD